MAEYALAFLLRHEWRYLPRWKEIIETIGEDEPPHEGKGSIEAILEDKEFREADKNFRKKFTSTKYFQEVYEEKVEPSLRLSQEVANIYSASLLLGIRSLFEVKYRSGDDLGGKKIALGFYGSGLTSIVMSGEIQEGYRDAVRKFNTLDELKRRVKISMKTYEELHGVIKERWSRSRFLRLPGRRIRRRGIGESVIPPKREFALVRIGQGEYDKGYRYYKFVE